jgi:hypothetical protein
MRFAWSPSEHQLALALSPLGAHGQSHAARRRLFIDLMTAAYISPNVFSLRNFLSNMHRLFLTVHTTSFISFIHHIYTHIYIFYLHVSFIISLLGIFMAGRLPSVSCIRYMDLPEATDLFQIPDFSVTLQLPVHFSRCYRLLSYNG